MSFDTRVVVLQPGGTVINEEWRHRRDAPGDSPPDLPPAPEERTRRRSALLAEIESRALLFYLSILSTYRKNV